MGYYDSVFLEMLKVLGYKSNNNRITLLTHFSPPPSVLLGKVVAQIYIHASRVCANLSGGWIAKKSAILCSHAT
jgi:hypothetical protein